MGNMYGDGGAALGNEVLYWGLQGRIQDFGKGGGGPYYY